MVKKPLRRIELNCCFQRFHFLPPTATATVRSDVHLFVTPACTQLFLVVSCYCRAACKMAGHSYVVRGLYEAAAEVDPAFTSVATFDTKQECEAWMAAHDACTNPDYASCHHLYTTLCDWEQVNTYLLRPLEIYRARYPHKTTTSVDDVPDTNAFKNVGEIRTNVRRCLDLPFHQVTSEESTLNSLRYLFFHMKCGIFVCIRDNQVRMFVPFVNKDFHNTWASQLQMEGGSVEEFSRLKV
jgi:hypothetical protein